VGSPFAFMIWETADAGATWQARRSWLKDYAGCSAVDADRSGKAVLFSTPYAFGGGLHRELRDATGTWSQVVTNNLVTNSGYVTAGCLNVSGTVSLSKPAPATDVTVTLADTLASANTPATVTVPAGATTKGFTVRTTPVIALEAGIVSARLGNLTLGQPLSVRPSGVQSGAFKVSTTAVVVKTKVSVQASANGIEKSKSLTLLVP
jgi:hypothetical protein